MSLSVAPDTRPGRLDLRTMVAVATILGTLPYLGLKVVWLSGSRVGLLDPDFGRSATMHVANTLTLAMDACVVVLAVAFVTAWGQRVPAALVLVPMWVATGLLAPVLVIVPLQLLLGGPSSGGSGGSGGSAPIADWVYAMVYAGFAWQGVFLMAGFGLYAARRWGRDARRALPRRTPGMMAYVVWVLLLLALGAVAVSDAGATANLVGDGAMVVLAGAGLWLLHGHGPRWFAVTATWLGSGACACWGLYHLVLLLVPNDLVTAPVHGLDVAAEAVRIAAGVVTVLAARQISLRPSGC